MDRRGDEVDHVVPSSSAPQHVVLDYYTCMAAGVGF